MMKNVLVTGTSTGIGHSTALELARRGWRVFAGVRKEADGEALKREAEGEVHIVLLDVADEASIDSATALLAEQTGGELHGLVNNAGVYLGGPLELMRPDEIRKTLDVNVTGLLLLTRACLPLLRAAPGRIVNISSISGLIAMPGVSVYAASKHAVEAVTDALRVELQPFGIKVIAVEPGGVKTPIWDKGAKRDAAAREDRGTAETRELYAPLVRLLEKLNAKPGGLPPEALAEVVTEALESAKPKNRYLVGKDAKALKLLTRLPDGLRDKTIAAKIWR
ncbi:SDR family oxidoreductase [Thioalkalivibrio sp. XN279]|uniref:SDR family oxidoreductase n=1 Tax=Thioalkalivibrio sp. XN279 TaxID=2714953 RepID=UPI001407F5D5|nr:SDR family oxidoreductase [Thioalkalivibrio sp. XN279]NHA13434.1 SDR family oxidoreductase [Thioalkalivibrio sp. XN279]